MGESSLNKEKLDAAKIRFFNTGYIVLLIIIFSIVLWLMSLVQATVVLIIASIFLGYLLLPVVRFFENPITLILPKEITIMKKKFVISKHEKKICIRKKGFNRFASVIIVYLLMALALFIVLSFIIPNVIQEANKFQVMFPNLSEAFLKILNSFNEWLKPRLPDSARDIVPRTIAKFTSQMEKYVYQGAQYTFVIIQKLLSATLAFIVIPLFTFYILLDLDWFKDMYRKIIPAHRKAEIMGLMSEIDRMLGRYIRGQILVSMILAVVITIALMALGIEYSFLIGMLSGAVNFIPYLGVVIGLVPAVLLALIYKGFWWAVLVALVLIVIQQLEGQVLSPAIIGEALGLPALVIIISIIIGGQLLGLPGMLIAIPLIASLKIIINYYTGNGDEKPGTESSEGNTEKTEG